MVDLTSVISIYFCWRSDYTFVSADALNLWGILQRKACDVRKRTEVLTLATCFLIMNMAFYLWALVTHLLWWDNNGNSYCTGLLWLWVFAEMRQSLGNGEAGRLSQILGPLFLSPYQLLLKPQETGHLRFRTYTGPGWTLHNLDFSVWPLVCTCGVKGEVSLESLTQGPGFGTGPWSRVGEWKICFALCHLKRDYTDSSSSSVPTAWTWYRSGQATMFYGCHSVLLI